MFAFDTKYRRLLKYLLGILHSTALYLLIGTIQMLFQEDLVSITCIEHIIGLFVNPSNNNA